MGIKDLGNAVSEVLAQLQVQFARDGTGRRFAGSVMKNTWNRKARREAKRGETASVSNTDEEEKAAKVIVDPFLPPDTEQGALFGFDVLLSEGNGEAQIAAAWFPPPTSSPQRDPEELNQSKVYFQQFFHEFQTRVCTLGKKQ